MEMEGSISSMSRKKRLKADRVRAFRVGVIGVKELRILGVGFRG